MGARVFVAALALSAAPAAWSQGVPRPARPATSPPAVQQQASEPRSTPSDSITLRIVDTELRSAVQILQQYLDKPVIYTGQGAGPTVTLESPHPVARADIPRLLRGLLDAQGYEFVDDSASGTYRARPKEVPRVSAGPASAFPSSFSNGAGAHDPGAKAPELFVIALKHARAVDVAGTINALFGRTNGAQMNNSQTSRTPTLSDQLRTMQAPPVDAPLPQSIPGTAGRSATLSGDLTIVPDSHGNNLLIRATRADFELIQAAVQQLDMRPAQVLIEVLIVEARRDRSFSLGVEAAIKDHHIGDGGTTATGSFTPQGAGLGDFTLDVMGGGTSALELTIAAAAARGDVKIVSRPVVLTANDEEAEVVVGSQRPFVQVSRALPTDNGISDQIIQYKDVGTKLTVRPTISIDGTVQLNVTQEVSNATTETAFNAPVISTRSIRTDLLARDSQTIVLGGLTDREHDVQTSGIPILSSIPFLGGFFGNHSRISAETELFIFLTPRVIRSDEDAAKITDPLRTRAKAIEP